MLGWASRSARAYSGVRFQFIREQGKRIAVLTPSRHSLHRLTSVPGAFTGRCYLLSTLRPRRQACHARPVRAGQVRVIQAAAGQIGLGELSAGEVGITEIYLLLVPGGIAAPR